MAKWSWMMGDEELEGFNMMLKWPSKKQMHLNVGSTNSMGLESNMNPHLVGNIHIYSIISAQGGAS
jgi:hypothetical protein